MRVQFKSFVAGFVCCAMLSATTAYAAVGSTRIDVFFKNLTYKFNGVKETPDPDKQGFVYKGTTYVPIRFVGESLGKEVGWDEETETIWISDDPGEFTVEDLHVKDSVTGATFALGMTKEEVEAILGEPDDEFLGRYMYEGLEVYYRENKAAGFIIDAGDNLTNRFRTNRDIGLGNPKNDVFEAYGNGGVDEKINTVSYVFQNESSGQLKKLEPMAFAKPGEVDMDSIYVLSILFWDNQYETTSFILIGDHRFATTTK
ncbi:copper amine oxidase N-terminal domain-containing protein [Paenibacillus sp. LHD-117]|uniref:copper amine oxidase N-terminal domain-containing protein n=1 Tax=Paenibacillus sp. LHD-117 TaxID=3071412 RepID=UPI0027E1F215|nr:copper amine oxidase N-terminal domain-containing protein [Paenibacillus sp. LHD-117]MDQ6423222.1 copper amine oxidase N-terminal domain-containing protein [Paenibacillus sp. LHD-117]